LSFAVPAKKLSHKNEFEMQILATIVSSGFCAPKWTLVGLGGAEETNGMPTLDVMELCTEPTSAAAGVVDVTLKFNQYKYGLFKK
jgi:hypothetical protein